MLISVVINLSGGLPWELRLERICLQDRRPGFDPWVGKIPWRRKSQPTPVFLPGTSHGQRSLVGYSPGGCKQSDMAQWLNTTTTNKAVCLKVGMFCVSSTGRFCSFGGGSATTGCQISIGCWWEHPGETCGRRPHTKGLGTPFPEEFTLISVEGKCI